MALTGRIVDSENGIAITLPDGWIRFDLDGDIAALLRESVRLDAATQGVCAGINDAMEREECVEAEVAIFEEYFQTLADTSSIVAVDLRPTELPFWSVAVVFTEQLGATPKFLVDTTPTYLRQQGITDVDARVIELGGQEFAKFTYSTTLGRPHDIVFDYALPVRWNVHWVSVQGARRDASLEDVADELASSLEILDPEGSSTGSALTSLF